MKMSCIWVKACGADDVLEGGVEFVQQLRLLGVGGVVELRLVDAFEEQVARFVLECGGDLRPGGVEPRQHPVGVGGHVGDPLPGVVVDVEVHVEAVGDGPVHDLLDAAHEGGVDRVGSRR
jgi:hypothetical protein